MLEALAFVSRLVFAGSSAARLLQLRRILRTLAGHRTPFL
jgi:hypothetical protein